MVQHSKFAGLPLDKTTKAYIFIIIIIIIIIFIYIQAV
jgi:hypothetical protein